MPFIRLASAAFRHHRLIAAAAVAAAITTAIGAALAQTGADPGPLSRPAAYARAAALTELGRQMFSDPHLSGSGTQSCASCHDPDNHFGPPNALPVQLGGADGSVPGFRAAPTITYLQSVPQFVEHFYDGEDDGDPSIDAGATGGLTWDGRADRGQDQARTPLTSGFEMANTPVGVVAAVAAAPYADAFRAVFGDGIFADPDAAFEGVLQSLGAFEQSPADFYPYSSKYDAYLAGTAQLTDQEAKGLQLFNDPDKGNCTACHRSEMAPDGQAPQFTDYGMIAIGVPRNADIPANADPAYHDLGLCGPLRTDFLGRADYCGDFRTPSLRNVASRPVFFHNGFFDDLRDVVAFYATRDTDPEKWYPVRADGTVDKFDDLPAQYQDNVNMDAPFGREAGGEPALTDDEIDDVVAFLKTLTDGWTPDGNMAAP